MSAYRLKYAEESGDARRWLWFVASNDALAISTSTTRAAHRAIELWHGTRRVFTWDGAQP